MRKVQWHFETDPELKSDWKAFFRLLPRGEESRVLTMLIRNFLDQIKKQGGGQIDPPKVEVDMPGNRAETDESHGIETAVNNRQPTATGNSYSPEFRETD